MLKEEQKSNLIKANDNEEILTKEKFNELMRNKEFRDKLKEFENKINFNICDYLKPLGDKLNIESKLRSIEDDFARYDENYGLNPEDIDWLIEQVKLVSKLDKGLEDSNKILEEMNSDNLTLRERVYELEDKNEQINKKLTYVEYKLEKCLKENEEITDVLVQIRDTFTEEDRQAEGHGMEDAVGSPVAVAHYALNKFNRIIKQNEQYREALIQIAAGDTWTAYPHDIAKWALEYEDKKGNK